MTASNGRWLGCALAALSVGCAQGQTGEDPDGWYAPGEPLEVEEPVAFTDVPYDFTGATPIAELPPPPAFSTVFAPADLPQPTDCAGWSAITDLPAEITGIVTLLPRFYFKTSGCAPDQSVDEDEKYYGSYFVEDASGGYFVLGDSKVAHFDMGDRVTLNVRALKNNFDQTMIAVHDVVEVVRGPEPIHYLAVPTGALGAQHVSIVVRVEGVVTTVPSTFGEVYLQGDDGSQYKFSLDAELTRRGVSYPVGSRLQVTGPVLFSFSEYTIEVLRVGQITVLTAAPPPTVQ